MTTDRDFRCSILTYHELVLKLVIRFLFFHGLRILYQWIQDESHIIKAFICSYFRNCSSVWHFCRASDREKLELLNKRALRAGYNNQASTYEELLECVGQCSLNDMCIQDHLLLTFKVIHGFNLPGYLRDMIRSRLSVKNLRALILINILYCNVVQGISAFKDFKNDICIVDF